MSHRTETHPNLPIRREYLTLAVIVVLGLALRIYLATLPRVIRWDEPDYLWLGKSLLTGNGYTISGVPELHYTPLYPILAGAIYVLTGSPEVGSAFWFVLLGAALTVPVYAIARRVYGQGVGLVAALLVALFPALSSAILYWGTMTEPLFILLTSCALWAMLVALERDRWWNYALTGALLCLAYLARPEGIVWLGAMLALVVLVWLLRGRLWRWRMLWRLGLLVGAFVLLALPYMFFLHAETGKWMATGKLGITYDIGDAVLERDPVLYDKVTASLDPETAEILWWSANRFDRGMIDIVAEDPLGFLQRVWRNAGRMRDAVLATTVFPMFLAAPLVLGWFRQPWPRRRLEGELALWFGALPVLAFLPFHVEVRFFSPALPMLVIWAAAGIWALGDWVAGTLAHWRSETPHTPHLLARYQAVSVALVMLVLLGFLGWAHVRTVEVGSRNLAFAHEAAGLWLRDHAPPDAAIMSRDLAISLYAERGFVASPRADYDAYLDYARRKGATHLVVDEYELTVLRPHLGFLLNETNSPADLEYLFGAQDARGRTIVYRIKD